MGWGSMRKGSLKGTEFRKGVGGEYQPRFGGNFAKRGEFTEGVFCIFYILASIYTLGSMV